MKNENNNKNNVGNIIIVGVCGSISAVEDVKLIRALKRKKINVYVVMTKNAEKIVSKEVLEWASENPVVTEITGKVEHVKFLGTQGTAKMLLICPSTANTISKIANGIDDTSVTTFASTALGSGKKIIVVPSMHLSMYKNPIICENIEKLKKFNVVFIEPKIEENKAKFPEIEKIIDIVMKNLV